MVGVDWPYTALAKAENTHLQGKYLCMADRLFNLFGFSCYDHVKYFHYKWVFCGLSSKTRVSTY